MQRFECDMCRTLHGYKDIAGLNLLDVQEDGADGNGIFYGHVCRKCAKAVFRLFKNKIWKEGRFV